MELPDRQPPKDSGASVAGTAEPEYFPLTRVRYTRGRLWGLFGALSLLFLLLVLLAFFLNYPLTLGPPDCNAQFGARSFNATLDLLAFLESGQQSPASYAVINSLGFTGKYQLGEQLLISLKYYEADTYYLNGSSRNEWKGRWTRKSMCDSYQDFLDNKDQVQERAIRDAFLFSLVRIQAELAEGGRKLDQFLRKREVFEGCGLGPDGARVNVTMAGVLSAAHLVGAAPVAAALLGDYAPCDELGTSMVEYLNSFSGCDFAAEDVEKASLAF